MDESAKNDMVDQLMAITGESLFTSQLELFITPINRIPLKGASNDQAKQSLEACDWNLEVAVNLQMDISHSAPDSSPILEEVNIPPPLIREVVDIDEVRAPIPPTRQVLVDDRFDVMSSGPRTRSTGHPIFGVRTVMRDFRQEARKL